MSTAVTHESSSARAAGLAETLARTWALGIAAGALAGAVVGGVLGRLVMRVLAATSPAAVGGITDDRAVVGRISLDGSMELLAFGTGAGAVQGLLYLLVRRALPGSRGGRVLGYALFCGLVGGALFVHGHDSFDFSRLQPEWLATTSFVLLPALGGAVTAAVVERTERGGTLSRTPTAPLLAAAVVLSLPGLSFLFLVPMVLLAALAALTPLRRVWQARGVTLAGRALLVAMCAWGAYDLTRDVVSMATDTIP